MPTYKVHYFNIRGLAEPIRLLLAYANADWVDERIPYSGYPSPVPEEIKAHAIFGQVPVLEFDGIYLSQSHTIARFIARKFNLAGSNDIEGAQCDEVADGVKDLVSQWGPIFLEKDEAKKKGMIENAKKMTSEKFLRVFSGMIEKNGGFVVGKSVTWADLLVAHAIEGMESFNKVDLISEYPALKVHREKIYDLPGIKEHIANRPVTVF